jgi:hypothetical protein
LLHASCFVGVTRQATPHPHTTKTKKIQKLVAELLDAERPHLAALTGDVVSGAFWDGHSRSWAAARAAPLVDVLAQRRVPHAFVAGNHDAEADLDRRALAALFASAPYGVTRVGPANVTGATNYFLDVLPSNSGSDSDSDSVDDSGSSSSDSGGGEGGAGAAAAAPAARLWFFDSMRRGCEGKSGWCGRGLGRAARLARLFRVCLFRVLRGERQRCRSSCLNLHPTTHSYKRNKQTTKGRHRPRHARVGPNTSRAPAARPWRRVCPHPAARGT